MKIISTPREIEIQFADIKDLEAHVENLKAMLQHNRDHYQDEEPHLSYCISSDCGEPKE